MKSFIPSSGADKDCVGQNASLSQTDYPWLHSQIDKIQISYRTSRGVDTVSSFSNCAPQMRRPKQGIKDAWVMGPELLIRGLEQVETRCVCTCYHSTSQTTMSVWPGAIALVHSTCVSHLVRSNRSSRSRPPVSAPLLRCSAAPLLVAQPSSMSQ